MTEENKSVKNFPNLRFSDKMARIFQTGILNLVMKYLKTFQIKT